MGRQSRIIWGAEIAYFTHAWLRAKKLVAALGRAQTRRALAFGVAPAIEHMPLLGILRPATIVDVGANRGQFALASRAAVPLARLICFEPGARAHETLTRVMGPDSQTRLVRAAIAETPGDRILHVTNEDDSSSILPVGEAQTRLFGTRVVGRETVHAAPLDQFVSPEDLAAPALLKIDVQGFEREVLEGCRSRLALFRWVYVESSFAEFYVGQMLAPELIDVMSAAGFELAGVFNQIGFTDLPAAQADFLFVNRAAS
jgi:FkbM family methyltransferase